MLLRLFGRTGLKVSVLGLGALQVGEPALDDRAAGRLLNHALDLGIRLIDTARGYQLSEERIGRHIAHRRDEYVLSSKCGYGVEGVPDWTSRCVTCGIDAALRRLRTDCVDIMHLHSCPLETLRRGAVVGALDRAVKAGKVRVAAYSGENDALAFALESRRFAALQMSVNVCDQRSISAILPRARRAGLGVIAKRPLANAFWRFHARPRGDDCEAYWERARIMRLDPGRLPWDEFALRFAAFTPGVHACIVGTADIRHLRRNVALVERGPLPAGVRRSVLRAFSSDQADWTGRV